MQQQYTQPQQSPQWSQYSQQAQFQLQHPSPYEYNQHEVYNQPSYSGQQPAVPSATFRGITEEQFHQSKIYDNTMQSPPQLSPQHQQLLQKEQSPQQYITQPTPYGYNMTEAQTFPQVSQAYNAPFPPSMQPGGYSPMMGGGVESGPMSTTLSSGAYGIVPTHPAPPLTQYELQRQETQQQQIQRPNCTAHLSTEALKVHEITLSLMGGTGLGGGSTSMGSRSVNNNQSIPRLDFSEVRDNLGRDLVKSDLAENYNFIQPLLTAQVRPTHKCIPSAPHMFQEQNLPLGCLIKPLANEVPIPVVGLAATGPQYQQQRGESPTPTPLVRCRRCRAYINCYVSFHDGGKSWFCNLCRTRNETPASYFSPTNNFNVRQDIMERPELQHAVVEFIAPTEYMVRPPQRPIFLFMLDVSYTAIQSGMLHAECKGILDALKHLTEDDALYISIMCFDAGIYLFDLNSRLSAPCMVVANDLVYDLAVVNDNSVMEPIEIPGSTDDYIVNLKDCYSLVEQAVTQIPKIFSGNKCVDSCFGAALTAALSFLTATGGKIVASVGVMPNIGEGRLNGRNKEEHYNKPKEYTLCSPASEWYKHRSLAASAAQISVDLLVNGDVDVDLATIAPISRYTSGHIYRFNSFNMHGMAKQMERILLRDTAFEAVLRIRTSINISAPNFFGHCYVRGPDLLVLPCCDTDTSYAVQLQIDAPLTSRAAYIQFALLYTTRSRERRIRIFTVQHLVTSSPEKVLNNTDVYAIAGMISKICVDFSVNSPFANAQGKMVAKLDAFIKYTRKLIHQKEANRGYGNQLLLPEALKLLPYLLHCFTRTASIRTMVQYETTPDERVAAGSLLMTAPIEAQVSSWCNWLHVLYHPKPVLDDTMPSLALTTVDRLRNDSLFLICTSYGLCIWQGKNLPRKMLEDLRIPFILDEESPVVDTHKTDTSGLEMSPEDVQELKRRINLLMGDLSRISLAEQSRPVVILETGRTPKYLGPCFTENDAKETPGYLSWLATLHKTTMSNAA